jgi:TolB-like protein/DNA-binding winged helix-turn-helix (wHTH) protein/Tfp pilus assembly protein PilF
MNDLLGGFRVGDFEVFPLQRRIHGPTGDKVVHARAMEVLLCLAESPGVLLERETIQQHVWGALHVRDTALTRCISELRHAFDDHHDEPRYIQTVPKRGYRLVAPVLHPGRHDPDHSGPAAAAPEPSSFWHELSRRRVFRVAIGYAVVAWVVTEVASTVFPGLMLPDWTLTLVIIMAVLGFPVAVILAWAFQLSEEGLEVDRGGLFGTPRQRKQMILGIAGVALVTVGAVALLARLWPSFDDPELPTLLAPAHASVAVLPFECLCDDPTIAYFGDGMAEELTTILAMHGDLAVASRTAAFYFSTQRAELPRIAESLRVRHILDGSVRREADRLRVNAHLIDASTGYHVWSAIYDRHIDQFISILDDIARQVAEHMGVDYSPAAAQMLAARPTQDPLAYDLYVRARGMMRQPHSDEVLRQAQQLFGEALAADPEFASAYAGLCDAFLFQYILDSDPASFRAADLYCRRAVELDARRAEVRMAVGHLYRRSGRFEEAAREYRQVLAHNPDDYDALIQLAEAYKELDRPEDAEPLYRKAIEIEPGYWIGYNYLARFYFRYLQDAPAAENFRRVTELRPDDPLGYTNLGAALLNHDLEGALQAWSRALEVSDPPSPVLLSNLGLAYFNRGDFRRAAEFQRQAIEVLPRDAGAWARLGTALRMLPGEQDASRQAYERAIRLFLQRLALNPNDTGDLRLLATSYAWLGDRREAERTLERLESVAPDQGATWFAAAKVALAFGELETATEHVREALLRGYPVGLARIDPELEPIRAGGALDAILQLAQQAEKGE